MPTQNSASTLMDIRQINRRNIYSYLYKSKKAISKQSIANALGISLPTVFQNIKELITEGLVIETGTFSGKVKDRAEYEHPKL